MKTAKIVNRMHRIQGQLNAIEKMLESDNHQEVLIQMKAVISGIAAMKAEYIKELINNSSLKDIQSFIDLIN